MRIESINSRLYDRMNESLKLTPSDSSFNTICLALLYHSSANNELIGTVPSRISSMVALEQLYLGTYTERILPLPLLMPTEYDSSKKYEPHCFYLLSLPFVESNNMNGVLPSGIVASQKLEVFSIGTYESDRSACIILFFLRVISHQSERKARKLYF